MKYNFQGLTSTEVIESRNQFGSNELRPVEVESFWDKLKGNFKDPIIIILVVALGIMILFSFFGVTEWYEAVAIAIAVLLSTFVSTYSEFKNETSFQQLQEEAMRIYSNVFRDGQLTQLSIGEIVAGDYILLQSGDKVPADGVIMEGFVKVNEASLTGESEGVHKTSLSQTDSIPEKKLESKLWLFRGSVVDDGEAILKVQSVGEQTIYGQLARELSEGNDRLSPLQVKLKNLASLISKFGYIAAITIFVAFMLNKILIANYFDLAEISHYLSNWEQLAIDFLEAGILAIIIVVAAVPEGLPMMIAIVLSLNMRKLLKEKVLVRKLLGIETAGSLNILFTDKTGTITKGKFEPVFLISGSGNKYQAFEEIPGKLKEITSFAILENTSCVISPTGKIEGGNQSGRAVLSFLGKKERMKKSEKTVEVIKTILFNSARKFSATEVISDHEILETHQPRITLLKGAPELILEKCTHFLDEKGERKQFDKKAFTHQLNKTINKSIRLIAVATSDESLKDDETIPENCMLLGLVGIQDEIREESKQAILDAQNAGIQIVMITGDRKDTAMAIAREINLLKSENDVALSSEELQTFTDVELKTIMPALRVISRALPTDKSRLVRIAKEMDKVVGMTGDGVNDSAALSHSDVGFSMGSGTEVSKEASDIVILDDNLYSISSAIRYGRTIFKSIRKFIIFQLTVNVAAVTTAFLGPFFGFDFPLTIIQLLWINIIMDTLAAIAFGGEPALKRYMKEKPVKRDENILTGEMISSILVGGLFITIFSIVFLSSDVFKEMFFRDGLHVPKVFITAFFNLFVFLITFNSLNARTDKLNIFENIFKNKNFLIVVILILGLQVIFTYLGGNVLRTTALLPREWLTVLLLSLSIIPVDLFRKYILKQIVD